MSPLQNLTSTELSRLRTDLIGNMDRLAGKKVLIVGDICLDEYLVGQVQRISPEAPVPVVEVMSDDHRLGLSANVAQNVVSLGGVPLLVGVIGSDSTKSLMQKLLSEAQVNAEFLLIDPSRPTTRKTRVMAGHHHVVRVDYETRKFLSPDLEKALLERVKNLIPQADVVVIEDYAKGVVSEKTAQQIIRWGHEKGKIVLVDPNRSTPAHYYRGTDVFKPNRDEAYILSGLVIDDLRDRREAFIEVGQSLLKKVGCKYLVVTRGQEGMSLFSEASVVDLPTSALQVFDVTGAGDTVIAALAMAWAAGLDPISACLLANYAAGIVVAKVGCVPCPRDELLARLKS